MAPQQQQTPPQDPVTTRSLASILLIAALVLIAVLGWSLYQEEIGLRPWRGYQSRFSRVYSAYLEKRLTSRRAAEKAMGATPEYQKLESAVAAATKEAQPKDQPIEGETALATARRAAGMRDPADEAAREAREQAHYRMLLGKFAVAAIVGLPLFLDLFLHFMPPLATGRGTWIGTGIVTLIVMLYAGRHFYVGAWNTFRHHQASMDTLIATGTGTAWVYSMLIAIKPDIVPALGRHAYFDAALIIIALINLGQALEMRARSRTNEAIQRLMGLQARTARVIRAALDLHLPGQCRRQGSDPIRRQYAAS